MSDEDLFDLPYRYLENVQLLKEEVPCVENAGVKPVDVFFYCYVIDKVFIEGPTDKEIENILEREKIENSLKEDDEAVTGLIEDINGIERIAGITETHPLYQYNCRYPYLKILGETGMREVKHGSSSHSDKKKIKKYIDFPKMKYSCIHDSPVSKTHFQNECLEFLISYFDLTDDLLEDPDLMKEMFKGILEGKTAKEKENNSVYVVIEFDRNSSIYETLNKRINFTKKLPYDWFLLDELIYKEDIKPMDTIPFLFYKHTGLKFLTMATEDIAFPVPLTVYSVSPGNEKGTRYVNNREAPLWDDFHSTWGFGHFYSPTTKLENAERYVCFVTHAIYLLRPFYKMSGKEKREFKERWLYASTLYFQTKNRRPIWLCRFPCVRLK